MDNALQSLLSLSFLFACLSIAAVTYVVKQIVEFVLDKPYIPASKASVIWKGLILPILPVVLGALMSYFGAGYKYPEELDSPSGRVAFGLVAGLFSGLIYRVLKSILTSKLAKEE